MAFDSISPILFSKGNYKWNTTFLSKHYFLYHFLNQNLFYRDSYNIKFNLHKNKQAS